MSNAKTEHEASIMRLNLVAEAREFVRATCSGEPSNSDKYIVELCDHVQSLSSALAASEARNAAGR